MALEKPGNHNPDQLIKQLAKNNRKHQTDAEKILWRLLRRHTLNGHKFRRQHKIGQYIVDFVCIEKKLVVELDGRQHEAPENFLRDELRSETLRKDGYHLLRFVNRDVFYERETVVNTIIAALEGDIPGFRSPQSPPLPSPLPLPGGEGENSGDGSEQ